MKKIDIFGFTLCALFANAQDWRFVNQAIPDGSFSGLQSTIDYVQSDLPPDHIDVSLSLRPGAGGAFVGDLFAMLVHGDSFHDPHAVILINRPGRDNGRVFGYSDVIDVSVTFTTVTGANGDFHNYRQILTGNQSTPLAGPLTGLWEADGRAVSPLDVLANSPRNTALSDFSSMDPNGKWTLFIADVSKGGNWNLLGWKVAVVPEPEEYAAVTCFVLFASGVLLRRRRTVQKPGRATG